MLPECYAKTILARGLMKCSCCFFPLLPQLDCNIIATTYKHYFGPSAYMYEVINLQQWTYNWQSKTSSSFLCDLWSLSIDFDSCRLTSSLAMNLARWRRWPSARQCGVCRHSIYDPPTYESSASDVHKLVQVPPLHWQWISEQKASASTQYINYLKGRSGYLLFMANSSSKCSYPSLSCLMAWQSLRKRIHERAINFIYPELDAFLVSNPSSLSKLVYLCIT